MNALDIIVQALELGAELIGSARRQVRDVGEAAHDRASELADIARSRGADFREAARDRAKDFGETARDRVRDFGESIRDFADEAPKRARKVRKNIKERFEPESSFGARVLPFVAGFSVGLGAALLFAPRAGRDLRAKLKRRAKEIEFPRAAEAR